MPSATSSETDRFRDLPGLAPLVKADIGIVGCGALGKRIAEILACTAPCLFTLYDPDLIEVSNTGTQGYPSCFRGELKAPVLADLLSDIHPSLPDPKVVVGKYLEADPHPPHSILVLTPDSMADRITAMEKAPPSLLVVDARATALTGRVIVDRPPFSTWMKASTYSDEEGFSSPCGLRQTSFTSYVLAGFAVAGLMQLLGSKGKGVASQPWDLTIDCMTGFSGPT
jgi:hypothetical protein